MSTAYYDNILDFLRSPLSLIVCVPRMNPILIRHDVFILVLVLDRHEKRYHLYRGQTQRHRVALSPVQCPSVTTQSDDKQGMECKLEFFSTIQICTSPIITVDDVDGMSIGERARRLV